MHTIRLMLAATVALAALSTGAAHAAILTYDNLASFLGTYEAGA